MTLLKEHDLGTPARPGADERAARDRRTGCDRARKAPRSCAPPPSPESTCPNYAPPNLLPPSAPAGCASSRSRAGAGTPASCTTPVETGMRVATQTTRLEKLRRSVMELYISDHPLDCLTCAANGDCELQDMAGAVGLREVRYGYAGDNHLGAEKDESNPYFTFDGSKCIVCSRCVRACEEIQGTFALTITGRGFASKVSPGAGSFLGSECVSCGACVQACPTATLEEKTVIKLGVPRRSVHHDLRVLRGRLLVQGRAAWRRGRAHGPLQTAEPTRAIRA